MKMTKMLMPTQREVPAEAEIKSHQLMLRAGMMRKSAAGIYNYLPLGLKVLRKVENIIRKSMDDHGAIEVLMPALLPAEAYMASGRWEVFGDNMFRLKDRNGRDFCLGPTHEELFTELVKNEVHSYKDLPKTVYQIQTKYRDESRPRFGIMRGREFVMKDAYSFDLTEEGLDKSYKNMYAAYCEAFDKLKLDYTIVDADSGAMGGSGSQEFMVKSDVGEDTIAYCDACGYAANSEKAVCIPDVMDCPEGDEELKEIHTPDVKTIEDLMKFFGADPRLFMKTLVYRAGEKVVAVMVRGDREVNEVKLANFLGENEVELADAATVHEVTGAEIGFVGPIGIKCQLLADNEVAEMKNFIVGANKKDYHYANVCPNRDFTPDAVADLRTVVSGDKCPKCGKEIRTAQGIEVGHIFKLGTKYSQALGCSFLDENSNDVTAIMGCYGIGVSRCIAAIIEQNCDDNGIIWPVAVAPYEAIVVPVNATDETQMAVAEEIYQKLKCAGIEVVMDDRDERAGVKFKDADLIGVPVRVTVGKFAKEGIVEFKLRGSEEVIKMSPSEAAEKVIEYIKNER